MNTEQYLVIEIYLKIDMISNQSQKISEEFISSIGGNENG